MAKLIDPETNEVVAETTNHVDLEPEVEAAPEATEAVEAPVEESTEVDLPEKYQGKSAAEIARMHSELEKRLGQQSSEVGELRRAFDDMVRNSIQAQQAPAPEVVEEDEPDFFLDPQAAVRRAIDNHPSLRQAQNVAAEMAKEKALAKLQQNHPDMKEILQDSKFQEWVGKSKYRQQMYAEADTKYDFDAANELLSSYKEVKGVVKQTAAVERVAQKNEVKKASTGSSRSNPEGTGSRKVYRRSDIRELMQKDPARYEAMMPEIMKAYSEGRIK